jgi:type IV pilus assembly protein PilM
MEKIFFSKLFPEDLRFWAKNRSVVGIDIGSSSLKIVQLRKEKEQAILETYGELANGPYLDRTVGQITQLSEDTAVAMLKDLLKETSATAKEAAVAVPVKSSFITTIRLPLLGGKTTMDEMINFEAKKYIPVPLNEVEIDWWALNKPEASSEKAEKQAQSKTPFTEVLLVAIHKEFLRKYQNIIKRAGLKIKFFEIEVFSVWRSSMFRQTSPVMVVDMGASVTKMSVVDKGVLRATRAVDKGGQMITNSIAKSLNISFERAEEIKRQAGLSSKPEYKELVSVMESVLNFIFTASKEFMLAYRRKHNDSIGHVILAGGGALLPGIVDIAVKNLGVEVMLADPFSRIGAPVILQETLREIGPTFSIAAGLALRGL